MAAGVAVIALTLTSCSDSSSSQPTSSGPGGSATVAPDGSSVPGADATAPPGATASPATNADGTPVATEPPDASVATSPTTRASQSGATAPASKTTTVSGAPLISNEATNDAAMGAEHCPHASEPVHADVAPADGVTVTLHWTNPEGIESSRVLHAPASGITFTSSLGPFTEGSITWWLTASDARNRTATTIHHLVAVNAC
jgi:hypothetical protein